MHVLDANEIFGMTFYTYDRIMESGNSDALVLYIKYLKQSRMQDTSKTFSLDKFMWTSLWRCNNRFYKAKKILKELWLIDVIKTMWPDWKFIDNFVRVNYLIDENRIRTLGTTYELIHSTQNEESGFWREEMLININKNNTLWDSTEEGNRSSIKQWDTENGTIVPQLDIIKNSDDVRELFDESEIAQYKMQLKILLKMIELWYKVKKTKNEVKKQFDWLKAKANLYNVKSPDWQIAWQTFYQKIDKRFDWHTENWKKVKNFKTSIIPFISK